MRSAEEFLPLVNFELIRGAYCFQHALNALVLVAKSDCENLPRIFSVDTPKGRHAYFVYGNRVFNQGVTWINNFYPDYSFEKVVEKGTDETRNLIEQVLGIQEDVYGYHRFIDKHFGEEGIKIIQELYKKQTQQGF